MADNTLLDWSEADQGSIGQGGEWETSLQLHLRPHLIDGNRLVRDENRRHFSPRIQKLAEFPERRRETEHGVMGDSFTTSEEKGARLFNLLVHRLTELCREYHDAEPPGYKEFGNHCP